MPSILPKSLQSRPWLLTLLAGLLAYFLSLRADFYMDDFMFVVNSEGDGPPERYFYFFGLFTIGDTSKMGFGPTEALPTLLHYLKYVVAGTNPVASHALSLALHLATALVLCFQGRSILQRLGAFGSDSRRCATAALIGSILFACHPFASEGVNYAKCIKIQMVAMFSIWFAAAWLETLQKPSGAAIRKVALSGILLTLSYHPGIFLGISIAAFLWLANPQRAGFSELARTASTAWRGTSKGMRQIILWAGGPLLAGMVCWVIVLAANQIVTKSADFPAHLLTQGRVIWQYLWRFFIPARLCSDHDIPLSIPGQDTKGLMLALLFGVLFAGLCASAILASPGRLKRLSTLCVLWLAPLAIRFTYSNLEPMVEYRVYPALPWFCLMLGMGFGWMWHAGRLRFPALILATSLATAGIVLSAARSHQWRDRTILASDVLRKYKTNTRALLQLIVSDYQQGDYEGVRIRHDGLAQVWQNLRSAPPRDGRLISRLTLDMRLIVSCKYAALAMAQQQGCQPALAWTEQMLANLEDVMPERFRGPSPDSKILEDIRDLLRDKGAEIDARFGHLSRAKTG